MQRIAILSSSVHFIPSVYVVPSVATEGAAQLVPQRTTCL